MIDPDVTKPSPERLFEDPNRYARAPRLDIESQRAIFHGYQEFELTKSGLTVLPEDAALRKKQELLAPYFQPRYLADRTMLDLGANAAFFAFWALQNGSPKATAVDMDAQYLDMVERAKEQLGFAQLRSVNANVVDWDEPADVVIALALIHWIYSCTACLGSLDAAVGKLARLTKFMLLVEWIDPADSAIAFFGHLDWNKNRAQGPYNRQAFEGALAKHFEHYHLIGDVSETRTLYVAFVTKEGMALSCPLPLLFPKQTILSSRWLARQNGVEFWSRVYDCGDVIVKQTTADLAEREATFLRRLTNHYFPRVESAGAEGTYSVMRMEKIQGLSLDKAKEQLLSSRDFFEEFFRHCLSLLTELQEKGICHRDIRSENILVRDGKPVLLDFGWAVEMANDSRGETALLLPAGLGESGRPPDGSFCDVYSMGIVLREVVGNTYPEATPVMELMTEVDSDLRITNPVTLSILLSAAFSPSEGNGQAEEAGVVSEYRTAIQSLLTHIAGRNEARHRRTSEREARDFEIAAKQLAELIPFGKVFILVDDAFFEKPLLPDRRSVPFLEKDGAYWGVPPDDATAIAEVQRMKKEGAHFLVFAWPSFWWLDYYSEFIRYIDTSGRRLLTNDQLVVFELL